MTCEENGLSCAARGEEGALEGSRDIARRVGVCAHDDVSVETWHTLRVVRMMEDTNVECTTALRLQLLSWYRYGQAAWCAGSDAPSSVNQSSNSCFKASLKKCDGYKLT